MSKTVARSETAKRPRKITIGELRSPGIRGVVVYCADFKCGHSVRVSADYWADDVRLSDIESSMHSMR